MKKTIILMITLLLTGIMTACSGITHCKECDDEVYKDGYCKYHYTMHEAGEALDDLGKGLFNKMN